MKLGSRVRWRGNCHTMTMECPVCRQVATVQFRGQQLLGIKHGTYELDLECPIVKRENANPVARFQRLVFNYADLEDRMHAAKEAIRLDQIRESRALPQSTTREAPASLSSLFG